MAATCSLTSERGKTDGLSCPKINSLGFTRHWCQRQHALWILRYTKTTATSFTCDSNSCLRKPHLFMLHFLNPGGGLNPFGAPVNPPVVRIGPLTFATPPIECVPFKGLITPDPVFICFNFEPWFTGGASMVTLITVSPLKIISPNLRLCSCISSDSGFSEDLSLARSFNDSMDFFVSLNSAASARTKL